MIFESLNTYKNITGGDEILYKLDELKLKYKEHFILEYNCHLFITSDEINTQYAMFSFCWSNPDNTEIHLNRVFHGIGTTYDKSMRHTYFGDKEDGYVFYLPINATIHALEILKNYFNE